MKQLRALIIGARHHLTFTCTCSNQFLKNFLNYIHARRIVLLSTSDDIDLMYITNLRAMIKRLSTNPRIRERTTNRKIQVIRP